MGYKKKGLTWVSQKTRSTWGKVAAGRAKVVEAVISDALIDSLIDQLHRANPSRTDWTPQILSSLAKDIDDYVATSASNPRGVVSTMGMRIVHRLVERFGAENVCTLRDSRGTAFDCRIPNGFTGQLPGGMKVYAEHRVMASVDAVHEPSPAYGSVSAHHERLDFKSFLSSCPALGELQLERDDSTNGSFGATVL